MRSLFLCAGVVRFGAVLAGIVSRRRPPKRDERSNHAFKTDQLKSLIPADCMMAVIHTPFSFSRLSLCSALLKVHQSW